MPRVSKASMISSSLGLKTGTIPFANELFILEERAITLTRVGIINASLGFLPRICITNLHSYPDI